MVRPQMTLAARPLPDLRRVKQSGDDRRGAHSYRDAGLDQLGAALLVGAVGVVVAVAHGVNFMAFGPPWEAA